MFRVVQRRTMSHPHMGIVGATTDTFILFENGVRRNRLVLPGLSNAASHAVLGTGLTFSVALDEPISLPSSPKLRCGHPGALLWLPSNKTFVPASEPHISIYVWPNVASAFTAGAGYIS